MWLYRTNEITQASLFLPDTQLHYNYNPCIHLSILLQVVTPADGGEYIIDNFGPRLIQTTEDSVYPVT